MSAASSLECFSIVSRRGMMSSGFHSPSNREEGAGTKYRTGSDEPKRLCIPVTGSHTDMAFQVSP